MACEMHKDFQVQKTNGFEQGRHWIGSPVGVLGVLGSLQVALDNCLGFNDWTPCFTKSLAKVDVAASAAGQLTALQARLSTRTICITLSDVNVSNVLHCHVVECEMISRLLSSCSCRPGAFLGCG